MKAETKLQIVRHRTSSTINSVRFSLESSAASGSFCSVCMFTLSSMGGARKRQTVMTCCRPFFFSLFFSYCLLPYFFLHRPYAGTYPSFFVLFLSVKQQSSSCCFVRVCSSYLLRVVLSVCAAVIFFLLLCRRNKYLFLFSTSWCSSGKCSLSFLFWFFFFLSSFLMVWLVLWCPRTRDRSTSLALP